MPPYKYIITIIGGHLNGFSIVKFSDFEMEGWVDFIREDLNVDCEVQKISLDKDGRDYKFGDDHVLGRCSADEIAIWIKLTFKLQ